MTREAEAAARFEAAHREDPRRDPDGEPRAVGYHWRLLHWVLALDPEAPEPLRLAARCQHLRRWTVPRDRFPMTRGGYHRWRTTLARLHADQAEEILRAVGYEPEVIARVRALLTKQGLGADAEVQRFEDAICLVFLETELANFAAKHAEPKLAAILQKTWKKMSPAGRSAALALVDALPEAPRGIVRRALGVV